MSNEYMDTEYPMIDLVELLRGLIKSALRFTLLGVILVVAIAVLMCSYTWKKYTPVYEASASFAVNMKNPFYASQQYYNNATAEQMSSTFPQILTSGLLSDHVKDKMGITSMPSVRASAVGSTNIFTLTVIDSDPQKAYDVLNCVIEVYPSVAEFVIGPTEMTLLNESGVPTKPTNTPNYVRSAIVGGLVGGVSWAGIAFLYWATHRTVNNEEELNNVVNLTCLGRLPRVRGVEKNTCPILNDSRDKFGFNESIRLMRVRVEKEMTRRNSQVLLVTSTIPNEGKTTVSINLATVFAQKGKKVLLVDCDLRNPSVGKLYNMDNHVGFTEFLKGECILKDTLHRMDDGNLYIVFGGTAITTPEQLLAHKNAKRFIEAARENFDYIILDTPPCALMADAADIGALADAILLTVRQDFACRQQIMEGVQLLGDCNKPIIGSVLNMTTPRIGKGGYSNYYGYGYGHYGSNVDEEEEE